MEIKMLYYDQIEVPHLNSNRKMKLMNMLIIKLELT